MINNKLTKQGILKHLVIAFDILFLFILLIISTARAEEINDYSSLIINTEISSSLLLDRANPSINIDYVYANLTFFPVENEF